MIISDSNPLISIIVPVYNAESYLEQCLGSILSQDVDSMEIIAVDDGSSDQSASILDRYSVQFGIIVIHQQNGGASRARNKALTLARGKYVGFVDADDWIEPHMYKTMCNVAEKEDADIVLCNIYRNQTVKLRKYFPGGVYRGKEIEDVIYPILISSLQESLAAYFVSRQRLRQTAMCIWIMISCIITDMLQSL